MVKKRRKDRKEFLFFCIVSLLFIGLSLNGFFEDEERRIFDRRFEIRGESTNRPELLMVYIDDQTLKEFGAWPFSNKIHSDFVEAAKHFGVNQVIFDVPLAHGGGGRSDKLFSKSITKDIQVFASLNFSNPSEKPDETPSAEYNYTREFAMPGLYPGKDDPILWGQSIAFAPLEEFSENMKGVGFNNFTPDSDGIIRKTPLVIQHKDKRFLNLGLVAVAKLWQVDPTNIIYNPGKSVVLKSAWVDGNSQDLVIPTDKLGNLYLNWSGNTQNLNSVSYVRLIRSYSQRMAKKETDLSMFELNNLRGKSLVVGFKNSQLREFYPAPFDSRIYLVDLQHQIMNTLLNTNFVRRAPAFVEVLLILLFVFAVWASIKWLPYKLLILLVPTLIGLLHFFSQILFGYGIWIPVFSSAWALVISWSGIMYFRFIREHEKNKLVQKTFEQYVTGGVMDQVLVNPKRHTLEGEQRELTILFADIRGFTQLAAQTSTDKVVSMLNEYLGEMTTIILKYEGTVDKFVGDAVMAYFGAPPNTGRHAKRAVQAGCEMLARMQEIQDRWHRTGQDSFQIGIGIDTGPVVMGNVGSHNYMDYTLIGDHVNQASRFCNHAQPGEILISQDTYRTVKDNVEVFARRAISIKGKEEKIPVFSVVHFFNEAEKGRRSHTRHNVHVSISYRPIAAAEFSEFQSHDLSGGGFSFLNFSTPHITGDEFAVEIQLRESILLADIVAKVVAIEEKPEGIISRFQFTKIIEWQQHQIVRHIHSEGKFPRVGANLVE
jgi:adenylate cyclase